MIRFGATAAIVPQGLIEALRESEDGQGVQNLPEPNYREGDRILISDGPMAGYEAIFAAKSGRERVLLLLDIAGKAASVQVGSDQIELVSSR